MARKTKRTIIDEEIPPEDSGPEVPPRVNPDYLPIEEETLAGVLDAYGQSAAVKIKLYQVGPKGPEYRDELNGECSEQEIQSLYGPGTYQLRIFIAGRYQRSLTVLIGERRGVVTPGSGTAPHDVGTSAALSQQTQLFSTLVPALINALAGRESSPIGELVNGIVAVHKLAPDGGGGMDKAMDAFLKGVDFGRDMAGGAGPDWKSELFKAIREVIPNVLPSMLAAKVPGMPGAAPLPGNAGASLPGNGEATMLSDDVIKKGLAYLKNECRSAVAVETILDWVFSHAALYGEFIGVALSKTLDEWIALDVELGREPYKRWFADLYNGLRSAFDESRAVDEDSSGPGRNGGNPTGHVSPSAGRKK